MSPIYRIAWGACLLLLLSGVLIFAFNEEDKQYRIGISTWGTSVDYENNIKGMLKTLAANGFVEGKNLTILKRNPKDDKEKQREIIHEFVDEKVDLIYTLTTPGTTIAKSVTKEIPIVFSIVTYPVESKIIASLDNSKNNLVGTRNYIRPGRQFYIIEKLIKDIKSFAFIRSDFQSNSEVQLKEFTDLLSPRGIQIIDIAAPNADVVKSKLQEVIDKVDVLYTACDTMMQTSGNEAVVKLSLKTGKPAFSCNPHAVKQGMLAGNVSEFGYLGEMAGEKVALILKGAKPHELQTQSPDVDYIVLNTQAARDTNVQIPSSILDIANEIYYHY